MSDANKNMQEVLRQIDDLKVKIQNGQVISVTVAALTETNEVVTIIGGVTTGVMLVLGFTVGSIQQAVADGASSEADVEMIKEIHEYFYLGIETGKGAMSNIVQFSEDGKTIGEPISKPPRGWASDKDFLESIGRALNHPPKRR